MDTDDSPQPAVTGELVARIRAAAVRAKRAGRTASYRCPTCQDTGWVFGIGTTYGGHHQVEIAARCQGPTATSCLYDTWRTKRRHEQSENPRGNR